jgi:glycosyltransferase involved in cell wall biosynthesis
MPNISIVTPFMNGIDLLPDYIAATIGAELIFVDNGSDEEMAAALQELPPDRGCVIRNETNLGFAAASNQGYAKATGDIIVFLNSDIAGDPSWLKLVADDVKDGALYGPSLGVQLVYGLRIPYIEGWCIAATRQTWERLTEQLCVLPLPIIHNEHDLSGDALARAQQEIRDFYASGRRIAPLISHNTSIEWIGGEPEGPWDAHAYPGPYWEDNDLCLRALQLDIALTPTQWPIQHKGGRTAGALVKHGQTFEDNRATFVGRVRAAWERMQER